MRAFVSFPMLMIALAPVAAIGQAAAPETAAPVVVADAAESAPVPVRAAAHGGPGDDGARHTRARRAGEGDLHRRHAAGAARRLGSLVEAFDMDGDGAITQEEVDASRTARLAEFDADGDGELTLEEYQALWLDAMHERMVDRFQAHDDDGTGTVTVEEFLEDYAGVVERADRNGDGKLDREDFMRPNRRPPAPDAE